MCLLHESNEAFPGIVKIKYARDEKNRLTSEEYFDKKGRHVDHPELGYAKKVIEYNEDGPLEKKYKAKDI